MSIINKSKKEKEVAEVFRDWYNNLNNSDFEATPDPNDDEADYLLTSSSDKTNQIKLQITTCDHNVINARLESIREPGEIIGFTPMHEDLITKAIIDKLKYPPDVQKELVLLVWSDMARFNSDYIRQMTNESCSMTNFKEIYLLELPDKESYPVRESNVIRLR